MMTLFNEVASRIPFPSQMFILRVLQSFFFRPKFDGIGIDCKWRNFIGFAKTINFVFLKNKVIE